MFPTPIGLLKKNLYTPDILQKMHEIAIQDSTTVTAVTCTELIHCARLYTAYTNIEHE